MAFRVPTANVSVDLTVNLKQGASYEALRVAMKEASEGELAGILGYTEDQLFLKILSVRYKLLSLTPKQHCVNDNFVKVVSWYDNEIGYSKKYLT